MGRCVQRCPRSPSGGIARQRLGTSVRGTAGNLGTEKSPPRFLEGATGEGQPRDSAPPGRRPCGLLEVSFCAAHRPRRHTRLFLPRLCRRPVARPPSPQVYSACRADTAPAAGHCAGGVRTPARRQARRAKGIAEGHGADEKPRPGADAGT